jgi:hypothetical protein
MAEASARRDFIQRKLLPSLQHLYFLLVVDVNAAIPVPKSAEDFRVRNVVASMEARFGAVRGRHPDDFDHYQALNAFLSYILTPPAAPSPDAIPQWPSARRCGFGGVDRCAKKLHSATGECSVLGHSWVAL